MQGSDVTHPSSSDSDRGSPDPRLDPFVRETLEAARTFDIQSMEDARSMLKRGTLMFMGSLIFSGVALAVSAFVIMDKREVQPYVLSVDRTTGNVTALVEVEPETLTYGKATDMGNIGTYLRSREEFSDATADYNYEQVQLMSDVAVMKEYMNWIDPKANSLSPLVLYPNGSVHAEITSIVFMGQNSAQIHYTRSVRDSSKSPPSSSWIAVIEWTYITKNMTVTARSRNPLGFTVTRYTRDETMASRTGLGAAKP